MCVASSGLIVPLAKLAPHGSRWVAAYFVVTRGRKRVLSLRVYCSLRSLRLALVSRCLPRSHSLARPGHRRASLAQHVGARSG
jgi:hypothetical protein